MTTIFVIPTFLGLIDVWIDEALPVHKIRISKGEPAPYMLWTDPRNSGYVIGYLLPVNVDDLEFTPIKNFTFCRKAIAKYTT